MGRPKVQLELQHTSEQLQTHYRQARTAVERRRTQVIWFLALGKTPEEVSELTAYSHVSILDTIHKYHQHGLDGLKDHREHNPGAPTLLSDEQILLLAQTIRHDLKQGKVWRGQDVVSWAKRKCQVELHKPRAYELLAAVRVTLQIPRPSHVRCDPVEVEHFKKKFFPSASKQLKRLLTRSRSGAATSTASG